VPFALTFFAALPLAIWLYLTFSRGFFWRLRDFDDDLLPHEQLSDWPRIVAVVPARNEAATIRQSLMSLLQQNYRGEFSVIIVDDHSEDATSQIVQHAMTELGAESRVTLCAASALPPGWTGKLWALNEGTSASRLGSGKLAPACTTPLQPRANLAPHSGGSGPISGADDLTVPAYYWFTDADIVHAADTLQRLVARAERDRLDLASLMVLLQAKTLPERALIPSFLFFFLKLYPPRWIAGPAARTAGAAGGSILLRRDALERIGGFSAIRGEVIDDCALARAVKQTGGRLWMGLTRQSVSLREYCSFHEIRDLIARTAFTQLRYSPLLLLGTLIGMVLTYVAPVAFLSVNDFTARILAACAWTLMSLLYLPTLRFYRLSPVWAPLLPIVALFYSYSTLLSAVCHYLGRGAHWKGRSQRTRVR
jgi:cellulose synthase/poly-beta-1,6-N-acetylglucosamine synthase-like glycosyltransferase